MTEPRTLHMLEADYLQLKELDQNTIYLLHATPEDMEAAIKREEELRAIIPDTSDSDMPERDEAWFKSAKLRMPSR